MSLTWGAKARTYYATLWDGLEINPSRRIEAENVARRLYSHKARYDEVEMATGVPWWVVAIIHEREAAGDFTKYLGNGEPLNRVTRLVPAGRGPFASFLAGAIDGLKYEGYDKIEDWSIEHALYLFEKYNGFGYYNKGLPSPYVVGGSNKQKPGKYVSDGHFDARAVDHQLGAATILKALLGLVPDLLGKGAAVVASVNNAPVAPAEPLPQVPAVPDASPVSASPPVIPPAAPAPSVVETLNTSWTIRGAALAALGSVTQTAIHVLGEPAGLATVLCVAAVVVGLGIVVARRLKR